MQRGKEPIRHEIIEKYLELNFPRKDTRYQYRSHLNKFFVFLGANPNKYFDRKRTSKDYQEDVLKYNNHLQEKHNPKSIPPQLSTIRNFLEENEVEFGTRFWKNIARRGKGNGAVREDRIPTITELQKILSYGDERDRAYFLAMLSSGMREGELCNIRISNIDFNSDPVMIKISPTIAKNKKRRITFMSSEASKAVKNWIEVRQDYVDRNVKKFKALQKYLKEKYDREINGTAQDRVFPWTTKSARFMWNRLLKKSKLNEKDEATGDYILHLYVLRKFFETKLSELVPEKFVKAMMGHSGYMGNPYFKPFEDIPKLKEMYKKGSNRLLVYEVPENQEAVDNIQKQMEDLQRQIAELQGFRMKVASTELRDEHGDTVIDENGNPVYVPDPRIPEEAIKEAFRLEKVRKSQKQEQERKEEYQKLGLTD